MGEIAGEWVLWRRVVKSKWKRASNPLSCFIPRIFSLTLVALSLGRSVGLAVSLQEVLSDRL